MLKPYKQVSVTLSELFPDPVQPPRRPEKGPGAERPRLASLSVVLPAFNEQYNLRYTVEQARQILPAIAEQWEIIIVNDGSRDATGNICDTLAAQILQMQAPVHLLRATRGTGRR